ncbi:MAG: L,D-transpeptidase [Patescibacteria group bacterium]
MKTNALLILVLQVFFSICAFAQPEPVQFGKLTFQKNGTFVHFGGTGNPNTDQAKQGKILARETIRQLRQKGTHPFEWQKSAPIGVTFLFPVTGNLEDIYSALKDHGGNTKPSWVWEGISDDLPVEVKIYLDSAGDGSLEIYQNNQLVAYMPCKSSARSKQPHAGNWSIKAKGVESKLGEKGRMSVKWNSWMSWGLEIENSNSGCYIHGGALTSESDGCVRVVRPGAHILYELVNKGSKVVITYL